MGDTVKKYLKNEFRFEMLFLEHENLSDFYLTCWQRNRSKLPLLLIRTLVFIGCVATLISAIILMTRDISIGHWFIFMTHWGLILITATSGLALAVSLVSYSKRSRDSDSSLIILVKLYWMVFNCSIAIAFFITIFYWIMLTEFGDLYYLDPVLDIFIHGINSVFMFVLLMSSRHPFRLLHVYLPLVIAIIYLLFSVIYYAAGGLSPYNTTFIYPMLDWSQPGPTIIMLLLSAILIIVIHLIVVALTLVRNAVTKRCRESSDSVLPISQDRYN